MALEVDLDTSSNSMYDWKGIREKAGEAKGMKANVRIDETSR
jgi:hypothetical protein